METQRTLTSVNTYTSGMGAGGWGLGQFILWFFVIALVVWVLLFTFNWNFTKASDGSGQQDLAKILIASIIISLIIVIVLWLIFRCWSSC